MVPPVPILNPNHDSKPEKIQTALAALGKRIVVTFEEAAGFHGSTPYITLLV
jgi:hypothetical protein